MVQNEKCVFDAALKWLSHNNPDIETKALLLRYD